MNPYERRIIHATLQDYGQVETYSIGDEPNRKVVIRYKKEYRKV
jgi:spoIIIJ-associated protein